MKFSTKDRDNVKNYTIIDGGGYTVVLYNKCSFILLNKAMTSIIPFAFTELKIKPITCDVCTSSAEIPYTCVDCVATILLEKLRSVVNGIAITGC